jgi:immune inhibitor A
MDTLCLVAPHPDVLAKLREELGTARESADSSAAASLFTLHTPQIFGLDDGTILPPSEFALGAELAEVRTAAATRPPLRGNLNVLVVLAQFQDVPLHRSAAEFETLFFGPGAGSVHEFYSEASGGLVGITGKVVGPFTLPRNLADYANGAAGMGNAAPNAQTMAFDAAQLALANVNATLDNDGNGFVDAFIVVHAGPGGEVTNNKSDIWSHKWVLPGNGITAADGTRVYAYLTVPEDARLGVCAHELGHLLFGWPDLYDLDYSSEGIGNWCLMSGGSWNGSTVGALQGDIPAHPSAWCKATQGWVNVVVQNHNEQVTIDDVHSSRTIYRLWKDGGTASEYFLVENRQRKGFDRAIPGDGLLIWHIDDSMPSNTNESHYHVALVQADGRRDLERAANFGDDSDPFPGTAQNATFDAQSTPSSLAYSGLPTSVAVTSIPPSSASMTVHLAVTNASAPPPHHHVALPPTPPAPTLPIHDAFA